MKLLPVITEMLIALGADIEYLQRRGSAQIRLRDGKLTETAGSALAYQFTIPPLQRLEPDTDIELRAADITTSGKIATCTEGILQVNVEQFLGDKVANATLIISNYQLLEILRKRLEKIRGGDINLGELATRVFDNKDFTLQLQKSYMPASTGDWSLNTYQLNAVRAALGSPVSFIWGPPGTGKTQTIASIIEGYLTQRKSVLLLSHTNMATDEALQKTLTHLGDNNTDYQNGKIVRFGSTSLTALKDKFVSPQQIAKRQGKPLRQDIQKLSNTMEELRHQITTAKTAIEHFDEMEKLEHKAAELEHYKKVTLRAANAYRNNLEKKEQELARLQDVVSRYSGGHLWQLLARRKLRLANHQICITQQHIAKRKAQLEELNKKIRIAEKKKVEVSSNKSAAEKQAPAGTQPHYQEIIQKGSARLQELQRKQLDTKRQLVELEEKVLNEANVIATTLTKSYTSTAILARDYDCIILDEASMAPLPAILCASGLAKKHVVIVGDFLQLPPVVQYKTDAPESQEARAVHDWLVRDIFTVAGIEQNIKNGRSPRKMLQLREQYRMHPSIAEVVNHIAYGRFGKDYSLKTATHAATDRWMESFRTTPAAGSHVAFYDTSACKSKAIRSGNGSYYNLHNALVCVALATEARRHGYTSIGIISAYRAQANLLQGMLADDLQDGTSIDADTVHRFQGGEKQLIILDVTTPDANSLYSSPHNDTALKLLNVAVSRAQEKCLLVGDLQKIIRDHNPESPILRIVDLLMAKNYPIYDTQEILKGFQETQQTDIWLERLSPATTNPEMTGPAALVDETDFYGHFMRDLLTAEHEVIIESPYITTRRINELLPYLEHLRRKGIEIYILTRSPRNHNGAMRHYAEAEIARLSSLSINVLAFPENVHRKLAIIDRRILWEGSLNILSQNDSREAMWRSEGEHGARQILQFLDLDRNLGEIGTKVLRHCEYCIEPEAWYWTRRGKYGGSKATCLLRQHADGIPPSNAGLGENNALKGVLTCPTHQRRLVRRTGRYGDFFGCPLYPACSVTRKMPYMVTA